jgi:hypothetical protein
MDTFPSKNAAGLYRFIDHLAHLIDIARDEKCRADTASGLAPGTHTFSIEVTHERGPGTDGSWVWIDALM